jgi:PRTRC genetic system protein A
MFKTKPPKQKPEDIAKAVSEALANQIVEFTVGKPGVKPVSYVVVKEGILEVRRTKIGLFSKMKTEMKVEAVAAILDTLAKVPGIADGIVQVRRTLNELPTRDSIPGFQLLGPKIPVEILDQIVAFFKAVYEKQETEAAALIRWNDESKEYYVEIPGGPDGKEQELSTAGVKYRPNPADRNAIVMDIHSHHTMDAFFSGTDDADEKFTQLYAVVGNIDHSQPTISVRARLNGEDVAEPGIRDVFDMPKTGYPESWMEKIKEPDKVESIAGSYNWENDNEPWPEAPKDSWYRRRDGESLSEYEKRMAQYGGSGRSLHHGGPGEAGWKPPVSTIPAQRDGEADEDYMERLRHGRSETQTTGDFLNSSEVLQAQEEIWDVLENEIISRAEIFQRQASLVALRDFLIERINDVEPGDMKEWAKV